MSSLKNITGVVEDILPHQLRPVLICIRDTNNVIHELPADEVIESIMYQGKPHVKAVGIKVGAKLNINRMIDASGKVSITSSHPLSINLS